MSRFPYSKPHGMIGRAGVLPFIPLTLYYTHNGIHITKQVTVPALVDSGSTVNVLPRDIGERLGLDWYEQCSVLASAGIVMGRPSLALPVFAKIQGLMPQQLLFAWSEIPSGEMRILLGQTDFFDEFYVDFRKPLGYFEIELKDV